MFAVAVFANEKIHHTGHLSYAVLLWATFLRSALVEKEDVDIDTGKVTIRESRGWQSRFVYLNDGLRDICRKNDSIIESLFPNRAVFFPNKNGGCYSKVML